MPEAQIRGALHTGRPLADNDGLNSTCFMDAPSGVQEITGTPTLIVRIRDDLRARSTARTKQDRGVQQGTWKIGGVESQNICGIVRDPVGTIKNVPKGASRFFGRIGVGLKVGSPLAGITSVSKAKAQLAIGGAGVGAGRVGVNQSL